MASSLLSLDFSGSPANPGNSVIHLCKSVKRTVSGSTSGYLSVKPMAISSRLSQSNVGGMNSAPPNQSGSICHSERSEESLFCGKPKKEGFLTPQTPFGMTEWCFSRSQLDPCSESRDTGHESRLQWSSSLA